MVRTVCQQKVEDMWQIFIGKLQAIITSYVPSKKVFFRQKRCAWVDFRTRKKTEKLLQKMEKIQEHQGDECRLLAGNQ